MKQAHKSKLISSLLILAALGAGFFIARLHYLRAADQGAPIVTTLHQTGSFKFINPLLLVDIPDYKDFGELKAFKSKVTDLINQKKANNKAVDIGVYFRDYSTGHWTGVNEDDKFYPASLMKLPLMIAYFKQAESDPSILNKKYFYDGKTDFNKIEITKPQNPIKAGQSYTVLELIRAMIIDSDNNAANLLSENIDQRSFHEIYTDLGQTVPDSIQIGNADYLSPKQYSTYLRILRNSTYLTTNFSEQALQIMSETNFKNGLSDSLPANVILSHKFGEFSATDSVSGQEYYELHDCGIVYSPGHNYLLCVMTKGLNRPDLEQDIKDISNFVYNEVSSGYK